MKPFQREIPQRSKYKKETPMGVQGAGHQGARAGNATNTAAR